jgi:hypothetical protein
MFANLVADPASMVCVKFPRFAPIVFAAHLLALVTGIILKSGTMKTLALRVDDWFVQRGAVLIVPTVGV